MIDLNDILNKGLTLRTSGTTGTSKEIFQSPSKILAASKVALELQHITPKSKIYTCCKTTHAGGLLAQTIPGLIIGAHVDVVEFNPYSFIKNILKYTHTHITPKHAKAIMGTKQFRTIDLTGITITCGADPVSWDIVEQFVQRGCVFVTNWGMSEVGPIAISSRFSSLDSVISAKTKTNTLPGTIMGDTAYCATKIDYNNVLWVKGDICVYDEWFCTNDIVNISDGYFKYVGRVGVEITSELVCLKG